METVTLVQKSTSGLDDLIKKNLIYLKKIPQSEKKFLFSDSLIGRTFNGI